MVIPKAPKLKCPREIMGFRVGTQDRVFWGHAGNREREESLFGHDLSGPVVC